MAKNRSFHSAKADKNDEFYTQMTDIETEMKYYKEYFKDKTVLCNCDDPRVSNFFKFFALRFNDLGLKKLISTCYKSQNFDLFSQYDSEKAIYAEYTGTEQELDHVPADDELEFKYFKGDGDFRSAECIELLKQADIVVTNPPFSLFREYVAQLMEYDKKFIIIGNQNNVTYKEVFRFLRENKLWLGYTSGDMSFKVPDYYEPRETRYWQDENGQKWRSMGNICWFTNLHTTRRDEEIILFRKYKPENYPKYDNYDAIEVQKLQDIPVDYDGVMGVPITFLEKYNPKQFEILGITDRGNEWGLKTKEYTINDCPNFADLNRRGAILKDGRLKSTYARILIRRIKAEAEA